MEHMLAQRHFDPELPDNTDQEIMAYLYRDMVYYHPEDLKRSRRGLIYDLSNDPAAALHFPGGMWLPHLDPMDQLAENSIRPPLKLRFQKPVPLTKGELWRMRAFMAVCLFPPIQRPLNFIRGMRGFICR
jgi:hypothetical protein